MTEKLKFQPGEHGEEATQDEAISPAAGLANGQVAGLSTYSGNSGKGLPREVDEGATQRGNYVMLIADTLHLVLPQQEVGAAEYLEGKLEAGGESGFMRLHGDEHPRRYAALSAMMTLHPLCPADRFMVTWLGEDGDDLGWCWNELQILIDVELRPQPVPKVLLAPNSPVDQYVEFDGKLAFLCNAQQLRTFAFASRS